MIKPCGHRLVIKQDDLTEANADLRRMKAMGLVIPEDKERAKLNVDRGIVVSVGPTAFKDFGGEAWCKIGDRVAFAKYSGKLVNDPETGEELMVCNDEDIVCIIEG